MTHGAPLWFEEKNASLMETCWTQSELSGRTSWVSIPTSCYVRLLLANAALSWANPSVIFHQGLKKGGGVGVPLCVTVIWVLLPFMVEVNVIIVTHENQRSTGAEMAPQGIAGEKGLVCSAFGAYVQTDTHVWVRLVPFTHIDTLGFVWHGLACKTPGFSLIDLEVVPLRSAATQAWWCWRTKTGWG